MKKIALSPGDPAGIGPEICLKSLQEINNPKDFELIGDIDFYRKLSKDLNLNLSFEETLHTKNSILVKNIKLDSEVVSGSPNVLNSKYTLDVLLTGSLGAINKEYAALVTGPINKKIINDYGFEFSGHTEFLADISQTKNVVMLLANSKVKVALLTTVFGLIVAIILQIFYNYIVSKIDSIVNDMEDSSITLIDILVSYKK